MFPRRLSLRFRTCGSRKLIIEQRKSSARDCRRFFLSVENFARLLYNVAHQQRKIFLRGDTMELATIFMIWLAITVIDNLAKRKKRRLPPPKNQNNSPDFDIPTLANDPNLPGEEVPIFIESPASAEVRQKIFTPPPRPKKVEQICEADTPNELDLRLTPSIVMNTFILTELIDKPKALQQKNFRR